MASPALVSLSRPEAIALQKALGLILDHVLSDQDQASDDDEREQAAQAAVRLLSSHAYHLHLRQDSAGNKAEHLAPARVGIAPPDAVGYRHQ
jgi:hypothetical protein